ncbi:MAG: DUF348 domain-containing protein [Anaerolineae bacterium]|nr:DUF348 domain-containing protein [Anaerolineae bacterium]
MLLSACATRQKESQVKVLIQADGKQVAVNAPAGNTVQNALDIAGIKINNLDLVEPPVSSVLSDQLIIRITRVNETFEVEESIIPFERQTIRNESLPEGQTVLIQKGANGVQQITYRRVTEDGIEVSRTMVKSVTIQEAMPEIVMIGVQSPFTAIPIQGRIAYLTTGNAWLMEGSTGNRRPLVTTGDLDGRIFALSPNGNWLLYTRKDNEGVSEKINSLWAVNVNNDPPEPISLRVDNIVNHAAWVPGAGTTITYSTVEPRSTAPGWQANNDLFIMSFNEEGIITRKDEIIKENSGGIYGWWGTSYSWSPDGALLAYARPDSIGLVNIKDGKLNNLMNIIPLQTRGDWAWVPPLAWTHDHSILYTVNHSSQNTSENSETSPNFDLVALLMTDEHPMITLVPMSGLFAYPVLSPPLPGKRYVVAYLQAIFPEQSETSNYNLIIMDQDGSNKLQMFPRDGSQGLQPQWVAWGPEPADENSLWLSIVYQGNLWLINPATKLTQQITGDGSISRIDWK